MLEQGTNDLVDRKFFYITGALAVLTGATVIWSIFGNLRLEATGVGVIVRGKHFVTVNSKKQGIIVKQYFKLNQPVKTGDILMSLETQTDSLGLEESTKTLKFAKPLALQNQKAGEQAEIIANQNIRSAEKRLKNSQTSLRKLINEQQLSYNELQKLYKNNQVSSNELSSTYSSLIQLKEQLAGLENNVREQKINYQQIKQSNTERQINLESQNISTASDIEKTRISLDQSKFIRSPIDGTMISYEVQLGGFANPGDALVTIAPKDGPLRAILLVGSDQYARIKKGDRVLVSPSSSPSIRFGYINGTVIAKADAPATGAELLKAFGSREIGQSLQQSFSQEGRVNLPYLVIVQIEEKDRKPVWTLGRQPPWGVQAGSQTSARIISEQVRPISLLIPFLRQI